MSALTGSPIEQGSVIYARDRGRTADVPISSAVTPTRLHVRAVSCLRPASSGRPPPEPGGSGLAAEEDHAGDRQSLARRCKAAIGAQREDRDRAGTFVGDEHLAQILQQQEDARPVSASRAVLDEARLSCASRPRDR